MSDQKDSEHKVVIQKSVNEAILGMVKEKEVENLDVDSHRQG